MTELTVPCSGSLTSARSNWLCCPVSFQVWEPPLCQRAIECMTVIQSIKMQ